MGRGKGTQTAFGTNIGTQTDNSIDKVGTAAIEPDDEQEIISLWDRTFTSFAPEIVIKMPYYFEVNSSTSSASLADTNQFKVNSLYDFDLTGTGHQPLGRDKWTEIYDYYKVLETRMKFTWVASQYKTGVVAQTVAGTLTDSNAGPSYMAPVWVGAMLDITANPPSTLTKWHEASKVTGNSQQRFTKIQMLDFIGSRGNSTVTAHLTWRPEMFDTAVIDSAGKNTWTAVGSDPANLNYAQDLMYNANTGNTCYYALQVEATMLVAFKNVNRDLLYTTN